MGFALGNLTIDQLEKRTGFVFSDKDRSWLESHRQDLADVKFDSDKFHIFDLPFMIQAAEPIGDFMLKMLTKYNDKSPAKESLQFAIIRETDEQKEKRLEKERKEKEWQELLDNPNAIWNIKWHMLVPVIAIENGIEKECFYSCFVNTYTTGHKNIPNIIDGHAFIRMDEEGFHGIFELNDETQNDADTHPEWRWVIGSGFVTRSGAWIGKANATFDDTKFNLKNCINNYIDRNGHSKEIHFDSIKKEV